MDPSSTGTCGQGQSTTDQPNMKSLPFTGAFRNTSQESIRMAVAEDTDPGADCGAQPSKADFRKQEAQGTVGKTKEQRGWRYIIRNFTPS